MRNGFEGGFGPRGFPEGGARAFGGDFWLARGIGLLLFLVVLGLVVWLVIRLVNGPRLRGEADPLRRAAARYAAGKIERVEFERIQADIAAAARPVQPAGVSPSPDVSPAGDAPQGDA